MKLSVFEGRATHSNQTSAGLQNVTSPEKRTIIYQEKGTTLECKSIKSLSAQFRSFDIFTPHPFLNQNMYFEGKYPFVSWSKHLLTMNTGSQNITDPAFNNKRTGENHYTLRI